MEENIVVSVDSYWKVRDLAHAVKEGNYQAINKAANLMSQKVFENNAIFIPIPSHTGKATYTLELAKIIANNTNGIVLDILSSEPRELLYHQKINGINPNTVNLGFVTSLKNRNISTNSVYLIDNVVDSGSTFRNASNAIKNVLNNQPRMLVLGVVDNDTMEKLGYQKNYNRMFVESKIRQMIRESINNIINGGRN